MFLGSPMVSPFPLSWLRWPCLFKISLGLGACLSEEENLMFGEFFGEWGSPNEKAMGCGGCSRDVWPDTAESCPISLEGCEGLG